MKEKPFSTFNRKQPAKMKNSFLFSTKKTYYLAIDKAKIYMKIEDELT